MIDEILAFNQKFTKEKHYEDYTTSKYPDKKLAIVSCMDTRLLRLLPAALGLSNGDAKLIKNAGGVISHPYGSVVRSLLISILELGVTQIMVIGHTDCGVQGLDGDEVVSKLLARGISPRDLEVLRYSGIDFKTWLGGFASNEESVTRSLQILRKHPLMPPDIVIRGFIMDAVTGGLTEVTLCTDDQEFP